MKKLLIFFIIALFPALIYSQSLVSYSQLGLKGKVKRVVEKEFTAEKSLDDVEAKELESKKVFEFYDNNSVKSEIFFAQNFEQMVKNNYSLNGKLISIHHRFRDNTKIFDRDSFLYLSNGLLDKIVCFIRDYSENKTLEIEQFEFSYDEFQNPISIQHNYYSEQGYKPSALSYSMGSMGTIKLVNDLSRIEISLEDDTWNIIDDETTVNRNDNTYQANRYGNLRKESLKIQYSYDDQKNWIKKICYAGTNPVRIITRDLSYF